MFIKSKNYDNSLKRVKVEFGTLIGLDEDKEAYVTLKELDTMTTLELKDVAQNGSQNELMAYFKEILPKMIVTHCLYLTEDKLMTKEQVADFIFEKLDVTSKVISEYTKYMFRTDKKGTDGDKDNIEDAVSEAV